MQKLLATIALLPALGFALIAADLQLAWDPSPTPGVTYRLYAHTNAIGTNLASTAVKLDLGTNLVATITQSTPRGHYVVTARKNGLESLPSNELVLETPESPGQLRVVIEQTLDVGSGSWTNLGFFRLRIGP